MDVAGWLVFLVAVAAGTAALADRWQVSAPLLLALVGLAGSYVAFVPDVTLTPEIVLTGLLPPLLYTAAIRTSLIDIKANRRAIISLSLGLVVFSTFVVALVVWWLLPVPFSVAVALGAVVAPPDAVATTAIARRVGLPRQVVTILEGESLLNDATALVTLRTAIAAIAGTFSIWRVGGNFVLAAVGGAAVGVAVALALGLIRRHVRNPVYDTTISFLAPFIAYLPADHFHGSGVIAVVTAGLILGQKAPVWQSAASRIAERTNWRTVQFVLENTVFLLIGLQVRTIIEAAWNEDLDHRRLITACIAVLLAVVVARPLWVFPTTYAPKWVPLIGRRTAAPTWRVPAVISWAGMRGVVTLAAAFVIPASAPYRNVLVLMALVVVGGTLLFQGTTLAPLVRALHLRGPSHIEDALQVANLLQLVTAAGTRRLDEIADESTSLELVEQLRNRSAHRANTAWERLGPSETERETPSEGYRRLRVQMLDAERTELLRVRDQGVLDQEVLQKVMSMLDLEESMIDRLDEADEDLRDEELVAVPGSGECSHLAQAPRTAKPDTPGRCQRCLDEGMEWVHLRMCLACGHIACCDSSPGNHATEHFHSSSHPVMRSVETGEAWRWCYVDAQLG
ncbi:MAG TPA: Na+/H+ antiporter [Jatrophihabitantaceae bacterium]|jgi:CPA1 family monovalent cation:H+ antiporter|nr:Na+/H+ antiporter [Jatrophihabitantaceae bacterium]